MHLALSARGAPGLALFLAAPAASLLLAAHLRKGKATVLAEILATVERTRVGPDGEILARTRRTEIAGHPARRLGRAARRSWFAEGHVRARDLDLGHARSARDVNRAGIYAHVVALAEAAFER